MWFSRLISVVDVDIAPMNPFENCKNVVSRLISVVDVDIAPMNSYENCENVGTNCESVTFPLVSWVRCGT